MNDSFFCHVPSTMGWGGGRKASAALMSGYLLTLNGRDSICPACCRFIEWC